MRKRFRLPKRPSNLLKVSLRDFQRARRTPGIKIQMESWHSPKYRYPEEMQPLCEFTCCFVCMAGAVMHCSGGAPLTHTLNPEDFPEPLRGQLYAINYLRSGYVYQAFSVMGRPWSPMLPTSMIRVPVAEYKASNPRPFYRSMRRLIKLLASKGH